jgi:tetratricopeptide (TPR) repeat protein
MTNPPHEVQLALDEFDRNQLPEARRSLSGDAFREAVREHFAEQFAGQGGGAEVVVTADRIIIRWSDSTEAKTLTERGVDFLRAGDYDKGIGMLRVALQRDPADADALFNLAMALSDQGKLDEAVELLDRLLVEHPSHAHGWVALGVAQARMERDEDAVESLTMAVSLNPDDGHVRKNLGAILSRCGSLDEAIVHLQAAARLLPTDPQCWFNLAGTLEEAGKTEEADEAYLKVLALDRNGRMGEMAEQGRSRIAQQAFRSRGGGLRPDAMSFCLGAMERFDGMPRAEVQKITFEIAMLGSRGLDVNDPAEQYTLRSIPGKFSGLHLLCIEYVGFQIIDPKVDIGFDLSAEHAAARVLFGEGK